MSQDDRTRRSFLTRTLTALAGMWVAVTGTGCRKAPAVGGPAPPRFDELDAGAGANAPAAGADAAPPVDAAPPPAPDAAPPRPPVTKYGGHRPKPKYGGYRKYGGQRPRRGDIDL